MIESGGFVVKLGFEIFLVVVILLVGGICDVLFWFLEFGCREGWCCWVYLKNWLRSIKFDDVL